MTPLDRRPAERDNGAVRASDREREATIRVLHDGRAEGRLSTSTFEQRVERALTAKGAGELRELTVDVRRLSRLRAWLAHARRSRPLGRGRARRVSG
ncbi:MAG TPA: DUF1707 domain-containing protein [Solirubrobacteraceae bacterium]|jgi:hypothetical protein